jgi:hypothetical protein
LRFFNFILDPTTPEKFWLVHGFAKTHPLSEGLQSIKKFLTITQEIVIWDGDFYGFGFSKSFPPEADEEFQVILEDAFRDWWV